MYSIGPQKQLSPQVSRSTAQSIIASFSTTPAMWVTAGPPL